jgi:steroid delta-isomerase-like uncharacterized protein
MTDSERNKQLVRRLFEAAYTHYNPKTLDEVLAENYVHHPTAGVDLLGREALRRSMASHEKAFPEGKVEIHSMVSEDDIVATRLTFHLTHRGEFWGIAPTGNPLRMKEMMFHRIENSVIAEGWNMADRLGIARQLEAVQDDSLPPGLRGK